MDGETSRARSDEPTDLAFHGHPYGLVLSDRHGAVNIANAAALALLGEGGDLAPGRPRAICEVIGCQPAGGTSSAAWVTVARVDGAAGLVLTEMRPGMADDRRRRTKPHWTTGPRLR